MNALRIDITQPASQVHVSPPMPQKRSGTAYWSLGVPLVKTIHRALRKRGRITPRTRDDLISTLRFSRLYEPLRQRMEIDEAKAAEIVDQLIAEAIQPSAPPRLSGESESAEGSR